MYKITTCNNMRGVIDFLNSIKIKPEHVLKVFKDNEVWKILYYEH